MFEVLAVKQWELSLCLVVVVFSPWAGLAGTRAQSGDRYGSGTLHSRQVLRGSLPLLSLPSDVLTFAARCLHVPINVSAHSSERWNYWARNGRQILLCLLLKNHKFDLRNSRYNGMAFIKIDVPSQYHSLNQYEKVARQATYVERNIEARFL
jgi:hypothetical protein